MAGRLLRMGRVQNGHVRWAGYDRAERVILLVISTKRHHRQFEPKESCKEHLPTILHSSIWVLRAQSNFAYLGSNNAIVMLFIHVHFSFALHSSSLLLERPLQGSRLHGQHHCPRASSSAPLPSHQRSLLPWPIVGATALPSY